MHIFRYNNEGTERRRDVIGAAPKIMRVPVYINKHLEKMLVMALFKTFLKFGNLLPLSD